MSPNEPGYDHPDMYADADDIGTCDCCDETDVVLFEAGGDGYCLLCFVRYQEVMDECDRADRLTAGAEGGWCDL
jgi:hypothetical protein